MMSQLGTKSKLGPGAAILRAWMVLWLPVLASGGNNVCGRVVYFGQMTAECRGLGLKELPGDLGMDIKVIKFKENKLTYLGVDHFKKYIALQELFLEKNEISSIAPEAFRGLSNLQILDLTRNNINQVPIQAFTSLKSLRELILKGNPIKYISENAFSNLPRIEILNFENCWLEKVDPKAFHGLTNVKEINLVNNELKALKASMEHSLPPNLSIFRLYRNPWRCDCKLRWLREWIEKTKVNWDFSQNTPACATPEIMTGLNWKHLKPDQFACPSEIFSNGTTSFQVEIGQNVTIECIVTGDPLPMVTWYKEGKHISVTTNIDKYMIVTTGHDPIRSTFTIWDVDPLDAGDYKCVAVNSAGRSGVTNKLWILTSSLQPKAESVSGISRESVLGMVIGGILFLIILVVCVVYGLRRRDRKNHAYRVRDYKKTNKKPDKSYINENSASSAGATTELLSEKEKEKERDRAQMELHNTVTNNATANNINSIKHNGEDYAMKVFPDGHISPKENKVEIDMERPVQEYEDRQARQFSEEEPLKPMIPNCNSIREVTPDLLRNENTMSKPHINKKQNHVTIKEENESKEGGDSHRDPPSRQSSSEEKVRHRDQRDHRGSPKKSKPRTPPNTPHPNSPTGSFEELLNQHSSSSRDSLTSGEKGSIRDNSKPSQNRDHSRENNFSTMGRIPEHRHERLPDGVKFATLPSKSSGAKNSPASSHIKTGTLQPARHTGGGRSPSSGKSSGLVQRPYSAHGLGPPTSPQSSPVRKHNPRSPAPGAPVPIIKLPDGHLTGKKDYRTLVVPPPPLPPANRSPFAIKPPSVPAALVHPGDSLTAPRKPPRSYSSSVYENPYSTVSRQMGKSGSQASSRQSSHDSSEDGFHRVGHQDEFGTCV